MTRGRLGPDLSCGLAGRHLPIHGSL